MSEFIFDIWVYLKAVFVGGAQWVFTFFDALGVTIFFCSDLGKWISLNESLARSIGGSIVLASFLLANFSLYRKSAKKNKLGFEIVKVQSVSLAGDLLGFDQGKASIADIFEIHLQALVNISNSGPGTSVRVFINAVEPDYLKAGASARDIEVRLRHQGKDIENPYYLRADEMQDIQLGAKIPCSTALIEEKQGPLSSFTKMKVTVGVGQTGQKPLCRPICCDLTPIHQRIDERVAAKIQHLQSTGLSGAQVVEVLKRYWSAHH